MAPSCRRAGDGDDLGSAVAEARCRSIRGPLDTNNPPQAGARYGFAEKCAALVLAQPHILNDVGTVVVDEVQMVVDETRRANLQFLLTLIRARRRLGPEPQIVALSAVIGDSNGL